MNALARFLIPDVLRTLGLVLLHFLWQGAALAALAAAALAAARTASARYVIGVATLFLMVGAPLGTFLLLHATPVVTAAADPSVSATPISQFGNLASHAALTHKESRFFSASALTYLVQLWFTGVMLLSLRAAGGLFLVARLRRRDTKPIAGELLDLCRKLQRRLGLTRAICYCESLHLDAPAVIGWFGPVVLLPLSALTGLSEGQLRTVIAHELAHIRRFDAFFNLFQVAAETLLFYHPAVWWLSERVRTERENCCDDVALSICGNPAEYARALALMEEWRVAPSFAMAVNRGPLATRVARLLGMNKEGSDLRSAGLAFGVLWIAVAVLAGNSLFGMVHTVSAHAHAPRQIARTASDRDPVIVVTAARPGPQKGSDQKSAESAQQKPSAQEKDSTKHQSYIDGLEAEGFDNLSADQLIALRVQGVTPEFIHALRAEGLKPNVDELIGMKVQGITPEYVRQIRGMKLNTDIDSLIGMKVQGITPEYVDEMHKLGFEPDTEQLIGMKVQGITPEYVRQIRGMKLNTDIDSLIGMKVQGITPEYVNEMRKLGFEPDTEQLVGMKVQGITPDYVRSLNELGLHPDAEDLIGMKVQGISADYIRGIRAAGLNPDKDEWIALRVQGVDVDYIKGLQAAGFKPDVEEVVAAKVQAVTPAFIEIARRHGFRNLDLKKLAMLKQAGVLE
jgi:beta-lactamase regulating signal transducer with metallopeptidase domain